MTDFSKHNDEAQFDRLVDGELSMAERQQLIASLDSREDGWRQCALAFLESQAWGGEIKQLVTEPVDALTTANTLPLNERTGLAVGKWFAIAASLLVAFSLGWLTQRSPDTPDPQTQIATHEQQVVGPNDELLDSLAEDAVTLLVRDTSGQDRRLQVPLMEVGDINEQFGTVLPAELRSRFRDHGLDVQRRRRFAPMFFEQNEKLVPMVVPVDDTYIVPVSQPVY